MEEELSVSADYKKWFNRGYSLRQIMPEVFDGLTIPKNEPSMNTKAFDAGAKQAQRENTVNQERDNLDRSKEHSRGG